jgi:hypothetical protein
MPVTTPKMGLHVWNQQTDPYDHAQLADNFFRLDYHDHSPGRGTPIPSEGIADGAITPSKLSSGLDVNGAFTTYRYLGRVVASSTTTLTGPATFLPSEASGLELVPVNVYNHARYFDPADYAVTGRSVKYRLWAGVVTNATAPAVTLTYSLNPVATWGTASTPTVATIGSALASVVITSPAASSRVIGTPVEFDAPAAGWYVFTIAISATTATNPMMAHFMELKVRQV